MAHRPDNFIGRRETTVENNSGREYRPGDKIHAVVPSFPRKETPRYGKCRRCEGVGYMRCGSCATLYCDRECQKKDWPTHKEFCKNYSSTRNDVNNQ